MDQSGIMYKGIFIECASGWKSLYEPLIDLCKKENVEVHQVKEKFGTLRFYTGEAPEYVMDHIANAEILSETTCELCGDPGKLRRGTWLMTNCDSCYNSGN